MCGGGVCENNIRWSVCRHRPETPLLSQRGGAASGFGVSPDDAKSPAVRVYSAPRITGREVMPADSWADVSKLWCTAWRYAKFNHY